MIGAGAGTGAVFLDRDGTLIELVHHLTDPADVRLIPGAGAALRRLRAAGRRVVVVTNQSVIGRGKLSEAGLAEVHAEMARQLAAEPDGDDEGACLELATSVVTPEELRSLPQARDFRPHHPDPEEVVVVARVRRARNEGIRIDVAGSRPDPVGFHFPYIVWISPLNSGGVSADSPKCPRPRAWPISWRSTGRLPQAG